MAASKRSGEYHSRTELEQGLFPKAHEARELAEGPPAKIGELLAARILKRAGRQLRKSAS